MLTDGIPLEVLLGRPVDTMPTRPVNTIHLRPQRTAAPRSNMSPFAAAILGMEGLNLIDTPPRRPNRPAMPGRSSRRAQSHYNAFQTVCTPATDDPPSYAAVIRRPVPGRSFTEGEALPLYECTVGVEARLLMNIESLNPLEPATLFESQWREIHLVLTGTLLSLYRAKAAGGPGKLIISYTLQHGEIGLATDVQHTVLVPQTRLAQLVPGPLRAQAWKKDAKMFKAEKQTIFRLRVESEQLLFAAASEATIIDIINAISAGIDIAPSIDERSIPKQCTVPRRRRRAPRPVLTAEGEPDARTIAEQESILQTLYPGFATHEQTPAPACQPSSSSSSPANIPDVDEPLAIHDQDDGPAMDIPDELLASPTREEEDIDFSTLREPSASRPNPSRSASSPVLPSNFSPSGKWIPEHTISTSQQLRYTRRCLPLLPANAPRASDVCMQHNGTRVRINWSKGELEGWTLHPPGYEAFHSPSKTAGTGTDHASGSKEKRTELELPQRSTSKSSSRTSVAPDTPGSSREVWSGDVWLGIEEGGTPLQVCDEDGITPLRVCSESAGLGKAAKEKRPALVKDLVVGERAVGGETPAGDGGGNGNGIWRFFVEGRG